MIRWLPSIPYLTRPRKVAPPDDVRSLPLLPPDLPCASCGNSTRTSIPEVTNTSHGPHGDHWHCAVCGSSAVNLDSLG